LNKNLLSDSENNIIQSFGQKPDKPIGTPLIKNLTFLSINQFNG